MRIAKRLCLLMVCILLSACSPASPADELTQEELGALLNDTEIELLEQWELSGAVWLIQAQHDGYANRFFFYDRETGSLDAIGTGPSFVELKEIVSDRYVILRTTGQNSESVITHAPEDVHCLYAGEPGTSDAVATLYAPSRLKLDQPVSLGSARSSQLAAFTLTFDGLELVFTQETALDAPDLTVQPCTLDPALLWDQELLPLHPCLSAVDFQAEGDTLRFRLVLDETVQAYTIESRNSEQTEGRSLSALSLHFSKVSE